VRERESIDKVGGKGRGQGREGKSRRRERRRTFSPSTFRAAKYLSPPPAAAAGRRSRPGADGRAAKAGSLAHPRRGRAVATRADILDGRPAGRATSSTTRATSAGTPVAAAAAEGRLVRDVGQPVGDLLVGLAQQLDQLAGNVLQTGGRSKEVGQLPLGAFLSRESRRRAHLVAPVEEGGGGTGVAGTAGTTDPTDACFAVGGGRGPRQRYAGERVTRVRRRVPGRAGRSGRPEPDKRSMRSQELARKPQAPTGCRPQRAVDVQSQR